MSKIARDTGKMFAVLLVAIGGCGDSSSPEERPIDAVEIVTTSGSSELRVDRGATLALEARAYREGSLVPGVKFHWRSETPSVATVDTLGVVTGVEYGTAEIVAEPVSVSGVAGRAAVNVAGPPVASIGIFPTSPYVDLNHSVQYSAQAFDAEGRPLTGVEFTWRVVSGGITLQSNGRVTGVVPGPARIEAEAWNGVKGTKDLRVTPVTALSPDTGRYGSDIAIEGQGLPVDAQVYFTGPSGSRIPAHILGSTPERYYVWVPVDAVSGPLHFATPTDSFTTSRHFQRTADDDIFVGCPPDGTCTLWLVPTTYSNPSLMVPAGQFKYVGFELEETTPMMIRLYHRGPPNASRTIFAYLFRFRPGPTLSAFDVGAQLWTLDPVLGTYVDSVTYSHPGLPPGIYGLRLAGAGPSGELARMAYGLMFLPLTSFENPPDGFEPNDIPQEASPTPITLPFAETALSTENRWAVDYYAFDLAEPSLVEATVTGAPQEMELVLLRTDTVDVFKATVNANLGFVVGVSVGTGTTRTLSATVPAGRYMMVAREMGHGAGPYSLEITATPAPGSPFTLMPRTIHSVMKLPAAAAARLEPPERIKELPLAPLRRH